MNKILYKDLYIITITTIITICNVSILTPIAYAQNNVNITGYPTHANQHTSSQPKLTTDQATQDDDDDAPEHWSDPKYVKEQHKQLKGMLVIFAAAISFAVYKRVKSKKLVRV